MMFLNIEPEAQETCRLFEDKNDWLIQVDPKVTKVIDNVVKKISRQQLVIVLEHQQFKQDNTEIYTTSLILAEQGQYHA